MGLWNAITKIWDFLTKLWANVLKFINDALTALVQTILSLLTPIITAIVTATVVSTIFVYVLPTLETQRPPAELWLPDADVETHSGATILVKGSGFPKKEENVVLYIRNPYKGKILDPYLQDTYWTEVKTTNSGAFEVSAVVPQLELGSGVYTIRALEADKLHATHPLNVKPAPTPTPTPTPTPAPISRPKGIELATPTPTPAPISRPEGIELATPTPPRTTPVAAATLARPTPTPTPRPIPTPTPQAADLTLGKFANLPFQYGKQASYTIGIRNQGGGAATSQIVVEDVLPNGVTYVSFTDPYSTAWSCGAVGQAVVCVYIGPNIAPGGVLPTLTINVRIASIADFHGGSDKVENCATVQYANDVAPGNNRSCVSTVVTPPGAAG
jgi:uncharacterized repeat protein (TIGR01451 family)